MHNLEIFEISKCEIDGVTANQILLTLHTYIEKMKEITLQGVDWNMNEALKNLIEFMAMAPKLKKCDISNQTNSPHIVLVR